MTGYNRQEIFTSGDVIKAEHGNNEFDQIAAAFAQATGHRHDGTLTEGSYVPLISNLANTDKVEIIDGGARTTGDHDVTGNITVAGTVDGRDVSEDGTRLDNIDIDIAIQIASKLHYSAIVDIVFADSPYSITPTNDDNMLQVDTSGGTVILTLPDTSTLSEDIRFSVVKYTSDTNTITINSSGTDTINGGVSQSLVFQYEHIHIISDRANSKWLAAGGVVSSVPATGVGYDPTSSLYTSTNVQDALDESLTLIGSSNVTTSTGTQTLSAALDDRWIKFDTVADAVAAGASLSEGDAVMTLGRNAKGDGGHQKFLVVTLADFGKTPNDKTNHALPGSLVLKFLPDSAVDSLVTGSTTAVIYVDPTGSDANDGGFDPAAPLATPQAAANVLSGLGAYLTGRWEVSFAAGTYAGGFELDTATQADYPIDIYGPTAGHPNVPTAIFDMAGDASGSGVRAANQSWVRATDIKVINATTGSGSEVNNANLALTNLHTYNCLKGNTNLLGGFVSARGGIWDGNSLANSDGYQSFYNSNHDFIQTTNDAATDALVIKNFARGALINEGVQGHMDNLNILNCTDSGLNFKRGAGAVNTKTMKIDGCGVGVLAENNAWFNNGIVFDSISANTIRVKTVGNSPELDYRTSQNEFLGNEIKATNIAAHTGTVAETVIWSPATAFPSELMDQDGHSFWGELELSLSNTSAVDFRVTLNIGTLDLAFIDIPAAETSAIIKFRGVILDKSAANNVVTTIQYVGRSGVTDYNPALDTIDFSTADRQMNITYTLGGTSDSITTRLATFGTTVGG